MRKRAIEKEAIAYNLNGQIEKSCWDRRNTKKLIATHQLGPKWTNSIVYHFTPILFSLLPSSLFSFLYFGNCTWMGKRVSEKKNRDKKFWCFIRQWKILKISTTGSCSWKWDTLQQFIHAVKIKINQCHWRLLKISQFLLLPVKNTLGTEISEIGHQELSTKDYKFFCASFYECLKIRDEKEKE